MIAADIRKTMAEWGQKVAEPELKAWRERLGLIPDLRWWKS